MEDDEKNYCITCGVEISPSRITCLDCERELLPGGKKK